MNQNESENIQLNYTQWFNENIGIGIRQALKFSIQNPRMALAFTGLLARFYFSNQKRRKWGEKGIQVPPMIIYSVTTDCNLDCVGCYAKLLHPFKHGELDAAGFADVVAQADEAGVSLMLIAGGEPFKRPELLEVTGRHPNILFTPFTNGMLVDESHIRQLKKQKHVLPIISFEGDALETDDRRGQGVYENGLTLIKRLMHERIWYGVSITLTRCNFEAVTSREFIRNLAEHGCKVFFFINYIPVAPGTDDLTLTQAQVDVHNSLMESYRHEFQALFLAFPGSEIQFGGCLAGGKGFVHINAEGDVQPCPFSPYSDASLREMPLIDALKSPLLKAVRDHKVFLDESNGLCALWQQREWVASLVSSQPGKIKPAP